MEIITERIEREFGVEIITTSPSVIYEVNLTDNTIIYIDNPSDFPERVKIKEIKEPYVKTSIFVPNEYVGSIMELCQNKRGKYISMNYLDEKRVNIHYEMPLSEIVYTPIRLISLSRKKKTIGNLPLIRKKSQAATNVSRNWWRRIQS